jgi:hypothetical protein
VGVLAGRWGVILVDGRSAERVRTLDERDLPSSPESWQSYKMSVTEILLKLAIDAPDIRDMELRSRCHPYRDRGFEAAPGA